MTLTVIGVDCEEDEHAFFFFFAEIKTKNVNWQAK